MAHKPTVKRAPIWPTTRLKLSPIIFVAVMTSASAEAYLIDNSSEFPKGITEVEIRARFGNSFATQLSFPQSGMSGVIYPSLAGMPTFYFCHGTLTYTSSTIFDADLIKFRHLVAENSNVLGISTLKIEGKTDSIGQEWTAINVTWNLPDGRTAALSVSQISGKKETINQQIIDSNSCLK